MGVSVLHAMILFHLLETIGVFTVKTLVIRRRTRWLLTLVFLLHSACMVAGVLEACREIVDLLGPKWVFQ